MSEFIDFEIFNKYPEVVAAFSTKKGGVSKGIYESMNLSLSTDDDMENILENYRIFADAVGIPVEDFVISMQTHTTNIRVATEADRGKGLFKERDYTDVDGLITNEKGVALCLLYADCVPVYLYDPVKKAIALLHSGWKGTCGRISEKGVRMLNSYYGSEPKDILCVIGPSICKDCYEVSGDLISHFEKKFKPSDIAQIFSIGRRTKEGELKYNLDLKKAIKMTLLDAGVPEENICDPEICTCCEHETFFSHRYTNGRRGNLAAVMELK